MISDIIAVPLNSKLGWVVHAVIYNVEDLENTFFRLRKLIHRLERKKQ